MSIQADVLDHGFVRLLNISGPIRRWDRSYDADDTDAANAARMSFDNMSILQPLRDRSLDIRLAEYLMRNKHTTPFEMIVVWLEMKLPIFVARQFVRHRTVSINEVSGRYVTLPPEFYIPQVVGGKSADKKQGQEDNLDAATQEWFRSALRHTCLSSYSTYEEALGRRVAPEHARMLLHLNQYTHWLWKQDLHNMMHFLSLRDHHHAQIEAQEYARAITKLLREVLPETMYLYDKYRRQEN